MVEGEWGNINDPKAIDGGEFFHFRKSQYNYLYFCPHCNRSFENKEPTDKCKFCGMTGIRELVAKKEVKKSQDKYRYYCTKCGRTFTSTEKVNVCQFCGYVNIHHHKWRIVGFFDKIILKLIGLTRLGRKLPVHRVDVEEPKSAETPTEREKGIIQRLQDISKKQVEKTQQQSLNSPKIKFKVFTKKKEEEPTH